MKKRTPEIPERYSESFQDTDGYLKEHLHKGCAALHASLEPWYVRLAVKLFLNRLFYFAARPARMDVAAKTEEILSGKWPSPERPFTSANLINVAELLRNTGPSHHGKHTRRHIDNVLNQLEIPVAECDYRFFGKRLFTRLVYYPMK